MMMSLDYKYANAALPLKPELSKKPKGVTTQMKALDEYFLMVVFTLLLNRVHVFAIFMFNLDREDSYLFLASHHLL